MEFALPHIRKKSHNCNSPGSAEAGPLKVKVFKNRLISCPSVLGHQTGFAFLQPRLPFEFKFAENDFKIILIKAPGQVD
jgi:hypothetical protein